MGNFDVLGEAYDGMDALSSSFLMAYEVEAEIGAEGKCEASVAMTGRAGEAGSGAERKCEALVATTGRAREAEMNMFSLFSSGYEGLL